MSRPVSILKEGAIVASGPGDRTKTVVVVRTPQWAEANGLKFPTARARGEGWFVGETWTGLRYFGRLARRISDDSVRTVRRFGMDCPEVFLYDVATVAVEGDNGTFAIWGVLGDRVRTPGPVFTRPENVVVG